MRLGFKAFSIALIGWLAVAGRSEAAITVTPLPFIPSAMSGDGNVVYGTNSSGGARQLLKWTPGGGMQVAATFPGSVGTIWDTSDDGSVVTGLASMPISSGILGNAPYIWTAESGFHLFTERLLQAGTVVPLSGDGTTAYSENARIAPAPLATGPYIVRGINDDGTVIGVNTPGGLAQVIVNGVSETIPVPGWSGETRIFAISPNGHRFGETLNGPLLFLWKDDQIQTFTRSHAWNPRDISDDGRIAVGSDQTSQLANSAAMLVDGQQYRLRTYLLDHGVDAANLPATLDILPDVSNDGTHLISASTFGLPAGTGTGYYITLPDPSSASLLAMVLGAAVRTRRRRMA